MKIYTLFATGEWPEAVKSWKEMNSQVVNEIKDIIRKRDTRCIASSIPGAKLLILPGEDHGSYIHHSEKIARIILDFCT